MKIKIICKKCGYKPEINQKMSNENWKVYNMKCPKCKKQMQIRAGDNP